MVAGVRWLFQRGGQVWLVFTGEAVGMLQHLEENRRTFTSYRAKGIAICTISNE